ncbi:hypothetical protein ACO0SA_003856 [Hanseniaspora valbyensis]
MSEYSAVDSEKLRRRQEISDRLDDTIKNLNKNSKSRRSAAKKNGDSIDIDAYTSIDSKIQRLKDEMIQAAKKDNQIILRQVAGNDSAEELENDEDEDDEDADFKGSDEEGEEETEETEETSTKKSKQPKTKNTGGHEVAMSKLILLPKVLKILNRIDLHDSLLENNILLAIRFWLDPLPDGSLPSYEIQKNLIIILKDFNLPAKNQNGNFTKYLKESGIGKLLIFYKKSKKVEFNLKKKVDQLLSDWSRPIIQASDNYKHKKIIKKSYDYKKHQIEQSKKLKQNLIKTQTENLKRKVINPSAASDTKDEGRTVIPVSSVRDYKYAPVSNVHDLEDHSASAGVGASLGKSELYKRINRKMGKK